MINVFYSTALSVLNHKQMGKITPSELNSMLAQVLKKNYSELFSDFRKSTWQKLRSRDSSNYANENFNLKQVIEFYIKEETIELIGGKLIVPEDTYLLQSIFDEKSQYEKVDMKVFNMLTRLEKYNPTLCSPIYTFNDNKLKVYPAKEEVDITYFRKIKPPKWTYEIVGSTEVFNADAPDFQDIDMHEMMIGKIFSDFMFMCGVNLQMQEVQQYAMQLKQEEEINKQ
jgi:hypothetical protein